jgi:hypothetical protein
LFLHLSKDALYTLLQLYRTKEKPLNLISSAASLFSTAEQPQHLLYIFRMTVKGR